MYSYFSYPESIVNDRGVRQANTTVHSWSRKIRGSQTKYIQHKLHHGGIKGNQPLFGVWTQQKRQTLHRKARLKSLGSSFIKLRD